MNETSNNNETADFGNTMLAAGTDNIPETLKRKSILCLYRDGTWTTGENVKEGVGCNGRCAKKISRMCARFSRQMEIHGWILLA